MQGRFERLRAPRRAYPNLGYSVSGLQTAGVPKSAFSRKYRHFRTLLTDARLHAGLTQASLAKKLGRPQSFVSKFENGERRLDVIEFLDVARAVRLDPIRVIDELSRK